MPRYLFDTPYDEEDPPEERPVKYEASRREARAVSSAAHKLYGKTLATAATVGAWLLSTTQPGLQHVVSRDIPLSPSQILMFASIGMGIWLFTGNKRR